MNNLDFLSKYTSLDNFQVESFKYIEEFDKIPTNILVSAPTGSGKSLIAEYAIYYNIVKLNKRVIYTSPIKSLSNQKLYDFNEKFNKYNINIGILTGDIKYGPNSKCLIMTTEILLNLLMRYNNNKKNEEYDIDFNEIGCIIFDEVHYINDMDRGSIWEQSIMSIPNNIQLIMLSATLNNPNDFGKWIEKVQRKPTNIISTNFRIVPLYFKLYYYISDKEYEKMDIIKKSKIDYNKLLTFYNTNDKKFNNILYDKINKDIHQSKNIYSSKQIINGMLNKLFDNDIYPLLFFVLNKKKCLDYALSIDKIYNNIDEQNEVEEYIKYQIRSLNINYIENNETYNKIINLLIKGIGIHHSGLFPVFKEIVEILYNKKLIKILFATETFAVGLNMPTKTVVFCNMYKCSRMIESHEFIQMSGRAGRRNIDINGNVILLPQLYCNITSYEISKLLNGSGQIIKSKFNINESIILKLIKNKTDTTLDDIKVFIKNTLMADATESNIIYQEKIVNNLYIELSDNDKKNLEKYDYYNNLLFKLSKKQLIEKKKLLSDINFINLVERKNKYDIEFNKLSDLDNYLVNDINNILDMLKINDIIDTNLKLTNKGYLASFITDTYILIIIDIITNTKFNDLDEYDIILIFSSLIFEDNNIIDYYIYSNQNSNKNNKWFDIINEMFSKTNKYNYDINYIFNFKYIYLVEEFIKNNIYISNYEDEDYLFEGNFIRYINKLLNLLTDIKNIYENTKNIILLKKIEKCIEILNKDWLKLDSIYLKMSGIDI